MDNFKVQYLFENLLFFGKIENPNFEGKAIDYNHNEILYLQLNVNENGIILDAKYRVISSSVVYAICEVFTQYLIKKNIRSALTGLSETKISIELGNIPNEQKYAIEMYKKAYNDILSKYNKKSPKNESETKFKRLLDFGDGDDPDTLSQEQVKKLLDAVEDLKVNKQENKFEAFKQVKESLIGNNEKILENNRQSENENDNLLNDNVPSFDDYVDNTVGFVFDKKEIGSEIKSEDLDNEKMLNNQPQNNQFDQLDLNFENDLNFSNYNFDDNAQNDKDNGEQELSNENKKNKNE